MSAQLPWLGLGLSANLDGRAVPHPFRLHERHPELFDFIEYSAPLGLEAARQTPLFAELEAQRATLPAVFHPVHLNLYGPSLAPAPALAELSAHLRAIGSPWVGNDVGWWHQGGAPFPGYLYLPPPLDEEGLSDACAHARHVQASLPVPLLLENPATTALRGPLHVLDFMAELHARTGLGLILDLGHLWSHQLSAGLPIDHGLAGFPLEWVIEIHLAGGVVTEREGRRFYADDHTAPVREELFSLLDAVLPRCERLRALTFEGDGHPPEVARKTLLRLREKLPAFAREPIDAPVPILEPGPPLGDERRIWRGFDALYAERDIPGDPVGHRAETDYRLAVLAEQLDRLWPLTRLLIAGTREGLRTFARSPEFRALFDGAGRALPQVFAAFARRLLRERPDAGAEAALAFESWALAQSLREGDPGLAEGVRLASFPMDLSELQFAAAALRRHLSGRAWGSGLLEVSGLESLAQVARRARPGAWWVALRRRGEGVEAFGLEPELLEVLRQLVGGAAWQDLSADPRHAEAVGRAARLGLLSS